MESKANIDEIKRVKNMKINLNIFISIALSVLLTASGIYADERKSEDNRGTISVTGVSSGKYPPDTVSITLSIEITDKTSSEAARINAQKTDSVINKLRGLLKSDLGDSIKTSHYSIQPVYEYDRALKKNVLTGYKTVNQITVVTKQIEIAGILIDRAIESGANNVQGVYFSLENEEAYCMEIIEKAAQRAKREADVVAKSLGVNIREVKSASPSCARDYAMPPVRYKSAIAAEAMSETATPVEAGDIKIHGTVSVIFFID